MMNKVKNLFSRWKNNRKIQIVIIAALVVVLVVVAVMSIGLRNSETQVVYKETQVGFGSLAVGVTESGSVDIGVIEQLFELDMSALQRVDTDSLSSSGKGGGGNMAGGMMGGAPGNSGFNGFSQLFNMVGGNTFQNSNDDSSLTISKVIVSVGQQVQEGDVLYELEEESVNQLQQELEDNVNLARADLEAVYADQKLSKQTAEYTYESSIAYGSYAGTEYNSSINNYATAVTEAENSLQEAKDNLAVLEAQLAEARTLYNNALSIYNNSAWSRDNVDKTEDTYLYVQYFQQAQSDYSTVQTMENKVSQLEQKVEQAESNLTTAEKNLNKAKREQTQGLLSAKQTKSLRELAYDTAQETLDISLAYLEEEAKEQESVYDRAQDKWEEYSSHISGIQILSQYKGVVTEVGLAEGDALGTNDVLITLYNSEDVTMTVTISESNMTDIAVGSKAKVNFIAYPEQIFEATVTEISDATTDSKGNVVYEVTATLQGDLSGLFQGMTGEVTFISEEIQEVLYVNKRAVITEGEDSYVKVKKADGSIEKRAVKVGFSDGINIEITEGLTEGETVLIESKLSKT